MFTSSMLGIAGTVAYLGFFFLVTWFLIIRPQRKREQQTIQMQSSIKNGDTVLLNCGIYGKVVDIINDNVIIEIGLNKGVRIPVKRAAIAGVEAPNLSIAKQTPVSEKYDDDDYDDYDDDEYEDDDE
ncbi:MAG: preprotein translocase subunit YajC [Epulopiscium sp. Nuni2H_MBin001]|nr:MAG: preprotein translocase subunit YajC [Epulopiscium sp. Nuni2H_MBin001]